MFVFNFAWAIVGLYMYANEMSSACQEEDIGIMVFAWSLIIWIGLALFCCCACCVGLCFLGFAVGAEAAEPSDLEAAEPLRN